MAFSKLIIGIVAGVGSVAAIGGITAGAIVSNQNNTQSVAVADEAKNENKKESNQDSNTDSKRVRRDDSVISSNQTDNEKATVKTKPVDMPAGAERQQQPKDAGEKGTEAEERQQSTVGTDGVQADQEGSGSDSKQTPEMKKEEEEERAGEGEQESAQLMPDSAMAQPPATTPSVSPTTPASPAPVAKEAGKQGSDGTADAREEASRALSALIDALPERAEGSK